MDFLRSNQLYLWKMLDLDAGFFIRSSIGKSMDFMFQTWVSSIGGYGWKMEKPNGSKIGQIQALGTQNGPNPVPKPPKWAKNGPNPGLWHPKWFQSSPWTLKMDRKWAKSRPLAPIMGQTQSLNHNMAQKTMRDLWNHGTTDSRNHGSTFLLTYSG